MSEFLSDQWFEDVNSRLAASPAPDWPAGAVACDVVLALADVPVGRPHSFTLHVAATGVHITAGDSSSASTIIRLGYDDAAALTSGRLDSATALRDGRIKVRGDVNALVPLAAWLHVVLGA